MKSKEPPPRSTFAGVVAFLESGLAIKKWKYKEQSDDIIKKILYLCGR